MTARTTPFGRAVAASAAGSVAAGLAFGNFIYLLMGAFLLASLLLARPSGAVQVTRAVEPAHVRAGDAVRVTREVAAGRPVLLHDPLPDGVRLAEGASNVRASAGGRVDLSYDAVAARRGEHALAPTRAHVLDPLGATEPGVLELGDEAKLVVEATAGRVGRVRSPRAWGASQYAEGDHAVRGPKTNDFRELREYKLGDPLKSVNWKASARASTGDDLVLLVNEYEPEGKKSVWIFLDTSAGTAKGTTTRSLLDVLVEGALTAADHYLGRGHRVGLATFGGKPQVLYPDHGREQFRRMATLLTYAEPAPPAPAPERPSAARRSFWSRDRSEETEDSKESKEPPKAATGNLGEAVEAAHGFLVREKPLLVLFSSLTTPDEVEGLSRAQVLASTGRRPAPAVLVVASLAPSSGPDAVIDRLAESSSRAAAARFQARGARVLRWNPDEAPLAALLAAGVR